MDYSPYPFFYEPSKFKNGELVLWCKALNDWDCNHLQNEVFVTRVLPEIISGYHAIVEDCADMNFDILAKGIAQQLQGQDGRCETVHAPGQQDHA